MVAGNQQTLLGTMAFTLVVFHSLCMFSVLSRVRNPFGISTCPGFSLEGDLRLLYGGSRRLFVSFARDHSGRNAQSYGIPFKGSIGLAEGTEGATSYTLQITGVPVYMLVQTTQP